MFFSTCFRMHVVLSALISIWLPVFSFRIVELAFMVLDDQACALVKLASQNRISVQSSKSMLLYQIGKLRFVILFYTFYKHDWSQRRIFKSESVDQCKVARLDIHLIHWLVPTRMLRARQYPAPKRHPFRLNFKVCQNWVWLVRGQWWLSSIFPHGPSPVSWRTAKKSGQTDKRITNDSKVGAGFPWIPQWLQKC